MKKIRLWKILLCLILPLAMEAGVFVSSNTIEAADTGQEARVYAGAYPESQEEPLLLAHSYKRKSGYYSYDRKHYYGGKRSYYHGDHYYPKKSLRIYFYYPYTRHYSYNSYYPYRSCYPYRSDYYADRRTYKADYLSITAIVDFASRGVPDVVIIDEIKRTGSVYHLTAETIAYLRQYNVSDRVIDYMLYTGRYDRKY